MLVSEVVLPVNEVVWSSKPWTIWRLLGHEAVKHDNKFRRPLSQLLCHAFFSEEEQQVRSTTLRASCSMVQQPEQATTAEPGLRTMAGACSGKCFLISNMFNVQFIGTSWTTFGKTTAFTTRAKHGCAIEMVSSIRTLN
ncbi:hypothetical protein ACQJBY_052318 [Aegilops geniculata]